ncbi:hypothetical protein C9994_12890, partial [Marivirga lumbricoides]
MKKHLYLTIAAILLAFNIQAQENGQLVYQKGDNILNAGFGIGYYNYGYFGSRSSSFPALTANYEIGFHKYFGVGPYVGYKSWNYKYAGGSYGFSLLSVGGRGSFHYSSLLNEALDMDIDDKKLDLYVVLIAGLEFQNYTGDYGAYFDNDTDVVFRLGPSLGARYYFNNNIGVFAE